MQKNELIHQRREFENYLKYWLKFMIAADKGRIFPEISTSNIPNDDGDLGLMYVSRILYGASRAEKILKDLKYKQLADLSLETLKEFKNPKGGYYWGRRSNLEWIHDAENVNMAQGFVLYGLAEYQSLFNSSEVDDLINEQLDFITVILKDDGGSHYLDGHDENWNKNQEMSRSFGTHFHIMEGLVKVYEIDHRKDIRLMIKSLIDIIMNRFIDPERYYCLHRFTENWEPLENENWAGHNAECSWVLCEAAKTINDIDLIEKTEKLAVLMMDEVIMLAKDDLRGGYANVVSEDRIKEKEKSWWPQAEIVLGLLNVYRITGKDRYRNLAEEQINYIRKFFVTETGEWHAELDEKGVPILGTPKVFFWKSMYHSVRYYDYLLNFLGSEN